MTDQPGTPLRLIGLEGNHLVLGAPDGGEYHLEITDMVRAAVRKDRPAIEQLRAQEKTPLSPRDIQARIRSGMSAGELADAYGVPIEHIRRYEGPVLAERQYIAELARSAPVSPQPDSPHLHDIVVDRLAQRGVDITDLVWDAYRSETHGWLVSVTYLLDEHIKQAQWTFKPSNKALQALESEARWLSETRIPDPPAEPVTRRHLSSVVESGVFDGQAMDGIPASTSPQATEALLDELERIRGTRSPGGMQFSDVVHDSPHVSGAPHDDPQRPRTSPTPMVEGDAKVYQLSAQTPRTVESEPSTLVPPVTGSHQAVPPVNRPTTGRIPRVSAQSTHASPTTGAIVHASAPDTPTPPTGGITNREVVAPSQDLELLSGDASEHTVRRSHRRSRGRQRSPMPSWDEIVFGTRTD